MFEKNRHTELSLKPFGCLSIDVLSVSKVLIASFFSNHRNFETERDTSDMLGVKPLDLKEIYQFVLNLFGYNFFRS